MHNSIFIFFWALSLLSNNSCSPVTKQSTSSKINLKKESEEEVDPIISDEKIPLLNENATPEILKKALKSSGEDFWENFLGVDFQSNHSSSAKSLYVLGDADGSFARLVLSALAAGYINLDLSVIEELEILLKSESYANIIDPKSLESFQKSKRNYNACKKVLDAITYNKNPNSKLIFLGDIVGDRLTCNLTATMSLIEKLHKMGAIFIKGNHDDERLFDEQLFNKAQNGEFRYNQKNEDKTKFRTIIKNCFKFAHYDKDFNILFTHAFISQNSDTSKLNYCEKIINNGSPEKVCEEINNSDNQEVMNKMTTFRNILEINGKIKIRPLFSISNYIHLHGHDEECALESSIYALSELKNGKYSLNPRHDKKIQPKICQIIKK